MQNKGLSRGLKEQNPEALSCERVSEQTADRRAEEAGVFERMLRPAHGGCASRPVSPASGPEERGTCVAGQAGSHPESV